MNRQRFVLHTAAISIAFLTFSASAWADLTGVVYRVAGNLQDATLGTPNTAIIGTVATVTGIAALTDLNFTTVGNSGTLGAFLNHGVPPDTVTPDATNGGWLNNFASGAGPGGGPNGNCYNRVLTDGGGHNCYSTEIEFTGTVTLVQGTTYTFSHDDGVGVSLGIGGLTNVLPANSVDPTTDVNSSFTWNGATGVQNVNVAFMGTNGNPEVLQVTSKAGTVVPEPSVVSMLFAMLVGVAGFAGILKKKLA